MRDLRADNRPPAPIVSVRETVESIWIAIVLAFVLRSFVIEAFVIPTGSMAPRLMGQHWQFDCPACGYHYAYGIPREGEDDSPGVSGMVRQPPGFPAMCPNCGHRYDFISAWAHGGDRVLVLKYLYRFSEPQPWDVVVFKNPQDNEENYIKRLIGLPGQMLEIVHGDIFVTAGKDLTGDGVIDEKDFDVTGDGAIDERDFLDERFQREIPWQILRKPPRTQDVMWQVIFDNDYQVAAAVHSDAASGAKTGPWRPAPGTSGWSLKGDGGRVFDFAGAGEAQELRFEGGDCFYPVQTYNRISRTPRYDERSDVNSDLSLSFLFTPGSPQAKVGLHLSSFEHHFRAWLSADGSCALKHGVKDDGQVRWDAGEKDPWAGDRIRPLAPGRGCQVALTHVDHRVSLWVDGKVVLETTDAQYPADRGALLQALARPVPAPTVTIVGEGGPFALRHVRLMADVYYTSATIFDAEGDTNKIGWGTTGRPMLLRKFLRQPNLDEFFVLGDNSPASKDSRMWGYHAPTLHDDYRNGTIPRYNMIGKAFFVYWPGGYYVPGLERLPIIPNVGRMRLIR